MQYCLENSSAKVMLLQKTHYANMKVVAPFLLQQYGQRNSMKMEVETPEKKKWMLEVGILEQGVNSATADLTFRSINNNIYHLTSNLQWQRLEGPFSYEIETAIIYVSPQNRHSQFSLLAKHHNSPQQRIIHLTVRDSKTAFTCLSRSPYQIDAMLSRFQVLTVLHILNILYQGGANIYFWRSSLYYVFFSRFV